MTEYYNYKRSHMGSLQILYYKPSDEKLLQAHEYMTSAELGQTFQVEHPDEGELYNHE